LPISRDLALLDGGAGEAEASLKFTLIPYFNAFYASNS